MTLPCAGRYATPPAECISASSRDSLLAALDRAPQTFCHQDAFPRNLLVRRDPADPAPLVAIDRAFAGTGALGEDLAPLFAAAVALDLDPAVARDVEPRILAQYLAGPANTGWHGDPRPVHGAYAAATALRFGPGMPRLMLPTLLDPARQVSLARRLDRPFPTILGHRSALACWTSNLANSPRISPSRPHYAPSLPQANGRRGVPKHHIPRIP